MSVVPGLAVVVSSFFFIKISTGLLFTMGPVVTHGATDFLRQVKEASNLVTNVITFQLFGYQFRFKTVSEVGQYRKPSTRAILTRGSTAPAN